MIARETTEDEAIPVLLITSSVPVEVVEGGIRLSRKFISGIQEHSRYWPGIVRVIMEPANNPGDNLDYVTVPHAEIPFELIMMKFGDRRMKRVIGAADIVLLLLYHKQFKLVRLCASTRTNYVLTTEFSLRTRLQIVSLDVRGRLKKIAKYCLEIYRELGARRAVRHATGIQSNGTPTFDAYRGSNANIIRFFDTRITMALMIDERSLHRRLETRRLSEPTLRLAFSGRLNKMKGADHLIQVARHLKESEVAFQMSIFGDGNLRAEMESEITRHGLQGSIFMMGSLDFESELVPFLRHEVDLFICCHRQGDPSCTYLETMSCGVPIVGYANEAFVGLNRLSGAGWITPMNNPKAMADKIRDITLDEVAEQSWLSLSFAANHTFEREFSTRMSQIIELAARQTGYPHE